MTRCAVMEWSGLSPNDGAKTNDWADVARDRMGNLINLSWFD